MGRFRVPRSRAHLTHQALREKVLGSVGKVLFQPHLLGNAALRPLEAMFGEMMHSRYALGVNSGTAGLFLALKACGVGEGDEVVTVGNSDISTTAAISHCGATPVICDVLETDYTMDPVHAESVVNERTAAILPVDLYGYPADVKTIREIAERHELRVIEDSALAAGARDYGEPVGAFADATVFSFGAYKPLGSAGNGGMVVTDDPEVAERLHVLRGYGRPPSETVSTSFRDFDHVEEGYNLPLDPLEGAVVSVKLPLLPMWTRRRREIGEMYEDGLKGLRVRVPTFRSVSEPTFDLYVIQVKERDKLYEALRARGIEAVLHYLPPVYRQAVYRSRPLRRGRLPVTDRLGAELLCLPVAPELTDDEVHYTIDTLQELLL